MLNAYLWTSIIMSYLTTVLWAYDKKIAQDAELRRAKGDMGGKTVRLSEFYVLITTALGGALGAIIGLVLFNHKSNGSKKWYYLLMIIGASIVQTLILLMLLGVVDIHWR